MYPKEVNGSLKAEAKLTLIIVGYAIMRYEGFDVRVSKCRKLRKYAEMSNTFGGLTLNQQNLLTK